MSDVLTDLIARVNELQRRLAALEAGEYASFAGNADKVDGKHAADFVATASAWTNWTPTVTQGISVSVTVNNATYQIINKACFVQATLTVTSPGTTGTIITIGGQPTVMQPAGVSGTMPLGTWQLSRSGVDDYVGILVLNYSATSWALGYELPPNLRTMGNNHSFGLAVNDVMRFGACYRVA